jgi:zinc D-Ala-D-Ala dipeptidase
MKYLFILLAIGAACQSNTPPTATTGENAPLTASTTDTNTVNTAATAPETEKAPEVSVSPSAEWPNGVDSVGPKTAKTARAAKNATTPTATVNHAAHGFSDVLALDPTIVGDIRYATKDNFTKAQIYDCPACLLRPEAAAAIVQAHKTLQKQGMGLKMFDCYRPRPYQQRLWDKVPNPDYVTPPAKGSMHSRGAAVDLTIVDANGKELDMGTPFDFFGVEAHTDNMKLSKKVLENRKLLRETLEEVGFKGIRTEWWHFSFQGKKYELSDYVWPCK